MSATLVWRVVEPPRGCLPYALSSVLRKNYTLDSHGTKFTSADKEYLRGLIDAGVDGARELSELIDEHEEIVIYLEY